MEAITVKLPEMVHAGANASIALQPADRACNYDGRPMLILAVFGELT